jgi:uncharacterized BrkB/YihY/UPF0761 family membrane protein
MLSKALWRAIPRAVWGWWNDNCLRLAASLAFYTALSLPPLVIIVVGVAGLVAERPQVAEVAAPTPGGEREPPYTYKPYAGLEDVLKRQP